VINSCQIPNIIVSLCITLCGLAHPDIINILGDCNLTIQICVRFRDYVM
jgi:hypothetical protein